MVDELQSWPGKAKAGARHVFGDGRSSCHLTTDGPLEELHAFALRLGLKRAWFQNHPRAPHYDLVPAKRTRALDLGAMYVSRRDQAKARIARRAGA